MELTERKLQRLKDFDYSLNNAYFITICTQNKLHLFGSILDSVVKLNYAGKMVNEKINSISNNCGITVDKYIVMPNHVHMIIMISHDGTAQGPFPTISDIIKQFKTITTKLYIDGVKSGIFPPFNKKIWQKSFYDHIVRDENEYLAV